MHSLHQWDQWSLLRPFSSYTRLMNVISQVSFVCLYMSLKDYFYARASLEERLKQEESSGMLNIADTVVGSKQLTFTLKKVSTINQFTIVAEHTHCWDQ